MLSAPTYFYLQLNGCNRRCNLDCYLKEGTISFDNAKKIVDIFYNLKSYAVLLDGEPLLWKNIYDLIAYIRKKMLFVGLMSSGDLLNEEKIKKLEKSDLNMIQIPIEGTREYHDSLRGKGSFEKTLEAMKLLKNSKIDLHVGTTVTKKNLYSIKKIHELVKEYASLHRLIRYDSKNYLSPEECKYLLNEVVKIRKKGDRTLWMNICYAFNISNPEFEKYIKKTSGCVGGKTSIYIDSSGYIYPCPMMSNKDIDPPNIFETDFLDVWNNWDLLKKFREGCKECRDCRYYRYCGGCRALSYTLYKDFKKDPGCFVKL